MKYHRNNDGIIVLDDIIQSHDNFIYLDSEKYFFKFTSIKGLFNELIGNVIASSFGINHVNYQNVEYNGFLGVISLDFINENEYVSANSILRRFDLENYNNLDIFTSCVKDMYNVDLTDDVVKLFLFDILIANSDRHSENYGVLVSGDDVKLSPVFDNAEMLSESAIYEWYYSLGLNKEDCFYNNDKIESHILYRFLQMYTQYEEFFLSKVDIINNNNILKILERVEDESKLIIPSDIRKKIITDFEDNNRIINKVISKRR